MIGNVDLEGLVSDNIGVKGMLLKVHDIQGNTIERVITPTGNMWAYDDNSVFDDTSAYALYVEAEDLAGNTTKKPVWELTILKPTDVYLPLLLRNYATGPDLVVDSIVATSDNVQVVIMNQGDEAVLDSFWIQAYIAPDPIPTGVNQMWYDGYSDYGLTWGVTVSALPQLGAGGSMTLTLGDAYFVGTPYSEFLSPLPPGTPVYVQVDAIDFATDYGAVKEDHEKRGGDYNNIDSVFSVP